MLRALVALAERDPENVAAQVAVWEDVLRRYPDDPQLRGLRAQVESLEATPAGVRP